MLENNFKNNKGLLEIGGVSVDKLAQKYKTPLYIYDQKLIKDTASSFVENFKSEKFETEIIYATKAFSNLYVLGLLNEYNLVFDCVSKEEIFVALKAGIKGENIHFHGNNKTKEELIYAIDNDISLIIIDSEDEYYLLDKILKEKKKKASCLLRINPDVKTDTHKFIQTSNADSKFGLNIRDENTEKIIEKIIENPNINLLGFHAHIGSQVKNLEFFKEEAKIMADFTKNIQYKFKKCFSHLNLGGGFGTRENLQDEDLDLEKFLKGLIVFMEDLFEKNKLSITNLSIEPGRSLISKAGSILYRIGSTKVTMEGYPLIFVDGGMSDNIRPSLYGARYSAILANKLDNEKNQTYRVGGKLCESGDILIEKVKLAKVERDDLLLVPFAGAYTYSMSSNYNKLLKPAVVFAEDGKDYCAVKRQSLEDLIKRDLKYKKGDQ
ncbi:diaminopimelate decarboxylase [Anaerococcus hydrogenalis]|uniref:diaminopimelate decarboxylase n=1 Tax=Anaerococcus hydrogenalis TaxID=33029 RepID=UPI0023F089F8|nr:diaminopimelate decarboxylase [Anaerococcus hydrogenalis]